MEIHIEEREGAPLAVTIRCPREDAQVHRLRAHIAQFSGKIQAKSEKTTCFVEPSQVLWFESVDDRTFLYTEDAVMEISHRLYELEEMLSGRDFLRISRSQIVNLQKLTALHPELNRTLTATLCNGERLSVSRKYVPKLREILSI